MKREIKFRAWCEGKHDNMTFSIKGMQYGVVLSEKGNYLDVESGWNKGKILNKIFIGNAEFSKEHCA